MPGYAAEHEIQDGPLTFEEACAHVSGQKLQGPEAHPTDGAPGDVQISDLPIRRLESTSAKIEQFADILLQHPVNIDEGLFANMYKLCYGQVWTTFTSVLLSQVAQLSVHHSIRDSSFACARGR